MGLNGSIGVRGQNGQKVGLIWCTGVKMGQKLDLLGPNGSTGVQNCQKWVISRYKWVYRGQNWQKVGLIGSKWVYRGSK